MIANIYKIIINIFSSFFLRFSSMIFYSVQKKLKDVTSDDEPHVSDYHDEISSYNCIDFNSIDFNIRNCKNNQAIIQNILRDNIFMRQLTYNYKINNTNIPKHVWQTYKTKNLPKVMKEARDKLMENNPDLVFHLFDDQSCRDFIQLHFDESVLNAFNCLTPGAYKSDLWRYCVMFVKGGIYIDIKYTHDDESPFNLNTLLQQNYFCRDIYLNKKELIYQAILVSEKNQPIFKKFIDRIVYHVEKRLKCSKLGYTGPELAADLVYENIELCDTFNVVDLFHHKDRQRILWKGNPLLVKHKHHEYYQYIRNKKEDYRQFTYQNVYNDSI